MGEGDIAGKRRIVFIFFGKGRKEDKNREKEEEPFVTALLICQRNQLCGPLSPDRNPACRAAQEVVMMVMVIVVVSGGGGGGGGREMVYYTKGKRGHCDRNWP